MSNSTDNSNTEYDSLYLHYIQIECS